MGGLGGAGRVLGGFKGGDVLGGAKGEVGVKKERGRGLLSCSFTGKKTKR